MSDQYPGQVPPTQIAPQGGGFPGGQPAGSPYPQNPGYYPPPPGGPGGPGGYPPAPPTGGGGGKVVLIVIAIVAVLVLIGGGIATALVLTGDDGDDEPKKKVTRTVTADTGDTSDGGETTGGTSTPPIDPTANAQAVADQYLNAIFDSDCATIQSLSSADWFATEYGDIAGCQQNIGMPIMEDVETTYDPVVADGSTATVTAVLVDNFDGTTYGLEWTLDCATGVCLVTSFDAVEA